MYINDIGRMLTLYVYKFAHRKMSQFMSILYKPQHCAHTVPTLCDFTSIWWIRLHLWTIYIPVDVYSLYIDHKSMHVLDRSWVDEEYKPVAQITEVVLPAIVTH